MSKSERPAFLDRPVARIVALGVMFSVVAVLVWISRGDLFPGAVEEAPASPQDKAFLECYEPRVAQLDKSLAAGELKAEQVVTFKERAEAMCRDQIARSR